MKCFDSLRLSLLDLVHDNPNVSRVQLLNLAGGDGNDVSAVVKNLESEGYLSYSGAVYALTTAGREYRLMLRQQLSAEEQQNLDQQSARKARENFQRKHSKQENIKWIVTMIISLFSLLVAVLALFIE